MTAARAEGDDMATKTTPEPVTDETDETDEGAEGAEGAEVVEPDIAERLKANREAAEKFKAASGIEATVVVDKTPKATVDLGTQEMSAFPAKEVPEGEARETPPPFSTPDDVVKEDTPRHFRCERYPNLVVPDYDVVFVDGWFTTDDPAVIEALGRIPEVVMQDKPED